MFARKCKAALDLLISSERGCILHLDDPSDPNAPASSSVKEVLISKHLSGQCAHAHCVLTSAPQEVHPVVVFLVDAKAVHSAVLRTTGSADLSGLCVHLSRERL